MRKRRHSLPDKLRGMLFACARRLAVVSICMVTKINICPYYSVNISIYKDYNRSTTILCIAIMM